MKLVLSALVALGMLVSPLGGTYAALASTDVALACPADAPEGWKRPGGYCDQRNTLDTIGTEKGNGIDRCRMDADIGPALGQPLLRQLVAYIYDPCCDRASASPPLRLPNGMLMRSDETILVSVC